MALRYFANSPATTLAASCTNVATTIQVVSVTGLPVSYPYTLILDRGTATEEVVDVTNAVGTTLTVTRGVDSTTAFAHDSGADVVHGISARDIREANSHINSSGAVHGLTGSIVGTSDTQTLTNKDLSSGTNTFPSSFVTLTGAQALTNKDLSSGTNTFPATLATSADLTAHADDTSAHGVSGDIVGTSDAQVLTNKDLSSGTNTFPATLVTTSGVQSLSNKTLVSPTISGLGERRFRAKFSNKSVTSSTTLQADDELTISVAAGTSYVFDIYLYCNSAANAAGDIAVGFTFPAGATLHFSGDGPHNSLASGSQADGEFIPRLSATSGSTSIPFGLSTAGVYIHIHGYLLTDVASGSLTLAWAQQTSNASASTVLAGSHLIIERVAV